MIVQQNVQNLLIFILFQILLTIPQLFLFIDLMKYFVKFLAKNIYIFFILLKFMSQKDGWQWMEVHYPFFCQ